jgi:hypothetical protein
MASADIMAQHHINSMMTKCLGHELGSTAIIVSCSESPCRRRKSTARSIVEVESLGILAAIAMNIQMLRNARKDEVVRYSANLQREHSFFLARERWDDARLATLAIGNTDRWATGDQVIIENVAHFQHLQLIPS